MYAKLFDDLVFTENAKWKR